ncbi:MAG: hypothetical protein DHS20C06_06520 [Hyphobacterium sp.]|nr:MAG: hypothetical protein DHS20C06_06520 [Hyphobacterium sp.]
MNLIFAALLSPLLAASESDLAPLADNVLDLFDSHAIVAIGDHHGEMGDAAFRNTLIQRPGLAERVDFIVLEFLNAHWQDEIDAYLGGAEFPEGTVKRFWRDTRHDVWEAPVYAEFLALLRDTLSAMPADLRPRILAGNAPVDWDGSEPGDVIIDGRETLDYPARLVICHAMRQNRTALVIFGPGHLYHDHYWSFMPLIDAELTGAAAVIAQPVWTGLAISRLAVDNQLGAEPALLATSELSLAGDDLNVLISGEPGRAVLPLNETLDYLLWMGPRGDVRQRASETALADPALLDLRSRQNDIRNAAPGPISWERAPDFDPNCGGLN